MVGMIDGTPLQMVVLERLADSLFRDDYFLRGSLLTRLWVGADRRRADDVDLLARYGHDPQRTEAQLTSALLRGPSDEVFAAVAHVERIWVDSDFPGLRLTLFGKSPLPGQEPSVQVDIGYGDPVAADSIVELGHGRSLIAAAPEVMFGWKLHGLWEKDGWSWRPKDVADLWLLQKHMPMSDSTLQEAIKLAFSSRQAPLWKLRRLLDGEMGRSTGSRRRWRALLRSGVVSQVPESLEPVLDDLAAFLRKATAPLELGQRPVWAATPQQQECEALLEVTDDFRRYEWPEGSQAGAATYVCERPRRDTFPSPYAAPTFDGCRQRLLRWECRGLTLLGETTLARPFPRFGTEKELDETAADGATVALKLDGSLVFPTRLIEHEAGRDRPATAWCWRTRRGRSQIADDAAAFAEQSCADYRALVEACLDAGQTPLFEWCSRRRLLVLDQPVDRLVLTGLRENGSGHLHGYEVLGELGERYGVATAPVLGKIGVDFTLAELRDWLATWRDREGVVLLTTANRLFKMKTPHYRWLHGAIEGPNYELSRWLLVLGGEEDALLAAADRRDLDLRQEVAAIHAQVDRLVELVRICCARYAGEDDRGTFARDLPLSGLARHWAFRSLDGAELLPMIRGDLCRRLEERGHWQELMDQIETWELACASIDS